VRRRHVAIAEADVVVLGLGGPIARESKFGAVTDRPTSSAVAGSKAIRHNAGRVGALLGDLQQVPVERAKITGRRELLVGPGAAALNIVQRACPAIAQSCR